MDSKDLAKLSAQYEQQRIAKPELTWQETKDFLRRCSARSSMCGYVPPSVIRQELARDRRAKIIEVSKASIDTLLGLNLEPYSTQEMLLWARGKPCPYCGHEMLHRSGNRKRASRDHLVPRVSGGNLLRGNVIIVCQSCNGDKGSRTLSQWLHFLCDTGDQRMHAVSALIIAIKSVGLPC